MKKYYLKTFGCQSNMADSDRIRGLLESLRYKNTPKEDGADLIVYNTCSVRQSAEDRIFGRNKILKKLKSKKPDLKVALTGCMTHYGEETLKKRLPDIDFFIPIKEILSLPAKLGQSLQVKPEEYLSIPSIHESKFRAWIPISYGCNNFCTYCIVPFARGREYSRPTEEILKEIKEVVKNGCKEVWLLGQNVNSYGMIEKTSWNGRTKKGAKPEIQKDRMTFANLIREVNKIPGNFWIRFTSAHPKDFSDDLIDAMSECEKFPKYINLPLQSGDNSVLRRMNRGYSREDFIKLVDKIRAKIPKIAISTDTIVGFPKETKKEFKNTVDIYKKLKFDMAFVAEYSERPGTAASISFRDLISHKVKDERKNQITEILKKTALKNSAYLLGQTMDILIDEEKNGRFFGKSPQNKTVEICEASHLPQLDYAKAKLGLKIGNFVKIKITKIDSWKLDGELI